MSYEGKRHTSRFNSEMNVQVVKNTLLCHAICQSKRIAQNNINKKNVKMNVQVVKNHFTLSYN